MNNYEACVILNAQLPDAEIDALIEKLKGQLTACGATIRTVSRWGKRKLGYEINKSYEGFYVVFFFTTDKTGRLLEPFERACRHDENVLRQMVVNVPVKRRGEDTKQIIPEPGWMSEFNMKLRPHLPRRRFDYDRRPRHDDRQDRPSEPAPAAAESAPAAPAAEAAPAQGD